MTKTSRRKAEGRKSYGLTLLELDSCPDLLCDGHCEISEGDNGPCANHADNLVDFLGDVAAEVRGWKVDRAAVLRWVIADGRSRLQSHTLRALFIRDYLKL